MKSFTQKKKEMYWVKETGQLWGPDGNFNTYIFDVKGYINVAIYACIGGGTICLVDENDEAISFIKMPETNIGREYKWYNIDIPDNCEKIKVTSAREKWFLPTTYSYFSAEVVAKGIRPPLRKAIEETKAKYNKVLFFGDSITEQGYYVTKLISLLGNPAYYNRGSSGTTVAKSSVSNSFVERIDYPQNDNAGFNNGLPTEADLVIVFGGILVNKYYIGKNRKTKISF